MDSLQSWLVRTFPFCLPKQELRTLNGRVKVHVCWSWQHFDLCREAEVFREELRPHQEHQFTISVPVAHSSWTLRWAMSTKLPYNDIFSEVSWWLRFCYCGSVTQRCRSSYSLVHHCSNNCFPLNSPKKRKLTRIPLLDLKRSLSPLHMSINELFSLKIMMVHFKVTHQQQLNSRKDTQWM